MPTLTVDGASVAYSDTGAPNDRPDAPTIVFGHGLLFSGWMFTAQIEALRADYRCVAIDWRGQGASPPTEAGYDMDTLAGDAIAVVEEVAGGDSVHYVGLSMGGFVGQRVAARRPELVRSLVLLDTSAEPEDRYPATKYRLLATAYRFLGFGPLRGSIMKEMFGPAYRADARNKPTIDEWIGMLSECDRNGIRKAVIGVADRAGVTDEIRAIKAPTLVAVGEHDHPTPPKQSRKIAELIPGARLEVVANSGHSSTIEQPEAVTALLRSFLADVDAGFADRARTD